MNGLFDLNTNSGGTCSGPHPLEAFCSNRPEWPLNTTESALPYREAAAYQTNVENPLILGAFKGVLVAVTFAMAYLACNNTTRPENPASLYNAHDRDAAGP